MRKRVYPVEFVGNERKVYLEKGEAFFDVRVINKNNLVSETENEGAGVWNGI